MALSCEPAFVPAVTHVPTGQHSHSVCDLLPWHVCGLGALVDVKGLKSSQSDLNSLLPSHTWI